MKGFSKIREAVADIEARKAAAQEAGEGGGGDYAPVLWFKLPDDARGKTEEEITSAMRATIRPLEDGEDVEYALVHKVDVPDNQWPIDIPCRDQKNSGEDCPGCEMGLKRSLKFWLNVIWRDAPDFPLDDNGKKYNTKVDYESIPSRSDKLAVISSGPVLADRFAELDEDLNGLTGYDFTVTREGLKLATKYKVKKVKKGALSEADKKLAAEKHDLSFYSKVLDYDDWVNRAKGIAPSNGGGPEEPAPKPQSPLRKKNIFETA